MCGPRWPRSAWVCVVLVVDSPYGNQGPVSVSSRQQGARRSLTRLAGPSGDRGSWLGARCGRVVAEWQEAAASVHTAKGTPALRLVSPGGEGGVAPAPYSPLHQQLGLNEAYI